MSMFSTDRLQYSTTHYLQSAVSQSNSQRSHKVIEFTRYDR